MSDGKLPSIEIEFTFGRSGIVATCQSTAPNVMDAAFNDIVAVGTIKAVMDTLKARFLEIRARQMTGGEAETPKLRMAELTEQGGD